MDACETGRRSARLVSFACGRVGCGGTAWFALHRAAILRRRKTRIAGTILVSPPVAFADFLMQMPLPALSKVIPRHSTLPVLGAVHIERDRHGSVFLTVTDLDSFLSLRLEAPQEIGNPIECLVPFAELQKLGKTWARAKARTRAALCTLAG